MAQLLPTRTAAARHQPSTHPTRDAPNRLTPPASPARPNECPDDTGRNLSAEDYDVICAFAYAVWYELGDLPAAVEIDAVVRHVHVA